MEIIFEFLFDIYLELMLLIVPEEKATSRIYKIIAIIVAAIVIFGVLGLFVWGFILVWERHNYYGLIPIIIAIVLSIVQIICGFVLHDRKNE